MDNDRTYQRELRDVPPDRVDEVVSDFENEGCSVKKTQQDNGKYIVTADCPAPFSQPEPSPQIDTTIKNKKQKSKTAQKAGTTIPPISGNAILKNYWLFRYKNKDDREASIKLEGLKSPRLKVTRILEEIQPNDIVYFWQDGKESGLYGWAQVRRDPRITPPIGNSGIWADIAYYDFSEGPLPKKSVINHPSLEDLLKRELWRDIGYHLTHGQVNALNELMLYEKGTAPSFEIAPPQVLDPSEEKQFVDLETKKSVAPQKDGTTKLPFSDQSILQNYWLFRYKNAGDRKSSLIPFQNTGFILEVTKIAQHILRGHIIYIWQDGKDPGLFGWAQVLEGLSSSSSPQPQGEIWDQISYSDFIEDSIPKNTVINYPGLKDLLNNESLQGIGYRLSRGQVNALNKLMLDRRGTAPSFEIAPPVVQDPSEDRQTVFLESEVSLRKKSQPTPSVSLEIKNQGNKKPGSSKPVMQTGKVIANKLNFRSGPSIQNPPIAILNSGDTVKVLGNEGRWFNIQSGNQTGYAFGDYIEIQDDRPLDPPLHDQENGRGPSTREEEEIRDTVLKVLADDPGTEKPLESDLIGIQGEVKAFAMLAAGSNHYDKTVNNPQSEESA